MTKLTWAAPERNKQPILAVLERVLPNRGTLLEVASGTGQHAAHFAAHLPHWLIQPSDVDAANLDSIEARRAEQALPNLLPPLRIDVCDPDWLIAPVEAVYSANLVHIAAWAAAIGLLAGAARHLKLGGLLIVYGPFRVAGSHTAPSNQRFDDELRQRDPRFGVRDIEAVEQLARDHGLVLRERVEMPANNQLLVLERGVEAVA